MIRTVASAWEYFEKWHSRRAHPPRTTSLRVAPLEDRITPALPIDPAPAVQPAPVVIVLARIEPPASVPVGQISLEAKVRTDLFGVGGGNTVPTSENELGMNEEGEPQRPGMVRQDIQEEPPPPEPRDEQPEPDPNPAQMVFATESAGACSAIPDA
ncbi:MAG: hypothetical protein HYX68_22180 [Planctomycetes bacterium]|nr:hypothetical protein [Planctomycetota bacterium]